MGSALNRLALAGLLLAALCPVTAQAQSMAYPSTRRSDVSEDYFGRKVADPYRWLEELDGAETKDWVVAENTLTFGYLGRLPQRDAIRARLGVLWNYPRVGVPALEAGRLFYRKNTGLQKQSVLYQQDGSAAAPREILDPNALSPDGSLAVASWSPSPDGKYLAYTTAQGGSDLEDVHIRELSNGQDLVDIVPRIKFSGLSWTKDGRGFFYSRFRGTESAANLKDANTNHQLWYHLVGSGHPDRLIYERPDHPEWGVGGVMSEDGRFLFVSTSGGTSKNRLFIADLAAPRRPSLGAPVQPVVDEEDAQYNPLGVVEHALYIFTNYDAPRGRIVAATLGDTNRAHWKTIVPEDKDVLSEAILAGGKLATIYLVDVQSRIRLFDLQGRAQGEVALPDIGTAFGLSGRADTPTLYYGFSTFLRPTTIYRYDLATRATRPFQPAQTAFDPSGYETRQVFYTSKDGTRVPMFITAKKGMALDGSHPTLLYAYGGFDISLTPFYSPGTAAWLEQGGVYALANLRGGAEYGEAWHEAGMLEKKQNVFDDFIAAAEYLISEGYTSTPRLAVQGGSNGGLLIGAVMTERPDLFGVALPAVGVMDMLRYQKFTGGQFWADEYGSSDDSTAVDNLLSYSPLHNLKPGTCYPATLVTTADHDDRVVPSHSFKFAAALQAAQGCAHPTLIRIETEGSHGYRPTDRVIAEIADEWAFALANMGLGQPAP